MEQKKLPLFRSFLPQQCSWIFWMDGQVYPTGQPAELYTWNDMYLGWQQATAGGKHLVVTLVGLDSEIQWKILGEF